MNIFRGKIKKSLSLLAAFCIVASVFGGLLLPAAAAEGDASLTIVKKVDAPQGDAALSDRYEFRLELWAEEPAPRLTSYIVEYLDSDTGSMLQAAQIVENVQVGSVIQAVDEAAGVSIGGYTFDAGRTQPSITLVEEAVNNVLRLYFARSQLAYHIRYYKDAAQTGAFLGEVNGFGYVGEMMFFNLSLYAPAGYMVPGRLEGQYFITENENQNIAYVVYADRLLFEYRVDYYADSAQIDNLLGSVFSNGYYGEMIAPDLSLYAPDGYYIPRMLSGQTVVTDNPSANVANVVFIRMPIVAEGAAASSQAVVSSSSSAVSGEQSVPTSLPGLSSRPTPEGTAEAEKGDASSTATAEPPVVNSTVVIEGAPPPTAQQGDLIFVRSLPEPMGELAVPSNTNRVAQPIPDAELGRLIGLGFDIARQADIGNKAVYLFTLADAQEMDIGSLPAGSFFTVSELGGVSAGALDAEKADVTLVGATEDSAIYPTATGRLQEGGQATATFVYTIPQPPAVSSSEGPVSSAPVLPVSSVPVASSQVVPASSGMDAPNNSAVTSSTSGPAVGSSSASRTVSSGPVAASSSGVLLPISSVAASSSVSASGVVSSSVASSRSAVVSSVVSSVRVSSGVLGAVSGTVESASSGNRTTPNQGRVEYVVQNSQTLESIRQEGVPVFSLGNSEIPLFGGSQRGVWSLVSLILGITAIVLSVVTLIYTLIQEEKHSREQPAEDGAQAAQYLHLFKELPHFKIGSMLVGVLTLVLMLLLEDFRLLMVLVDRWTILFAALLALQVVLLFLARMVSRAESEEEENGSSTEEKAK